MVTHLSPTVIRQINGVLDAMPYPRVYDLKADALLGAEQFAARMGVTIYVVDWTDCVSRGYAVASLTGIRNLGVALDQVVASVKPSAEAA